MSNDQANILIMELKKLNKNIDKIANEGLNVYSEIEEKEEEE